MTYSEFALLAAAGLFLFWLIQAIVVARYVSYMQPQEAPISETLPIRPTCAVLMALRGGDPGLRRTLLEHLEQQGVDYHLHLIVDDRHDPAVSTIQGLPSEYNDRWSLHLLRLDSDRCSLKCLGLSQVATELLQSDLPPEFLAFADSDGIVSRDWLSRLLAPLVADHRAAANASDSGRPRRGQPLGATTGHRWYTCRPPSGWGSTDGLDGDVPRANLIVDDGWPTGLDAERESRSEVAQPTSMGVESLSLGACVRYFWNLGSLPQMHLHRVVWGGSWAIPSHVLEQTGILGQWKTALFEDTQIASLLNTSGFAVKTAPGVFVLNYESLGAPQARAWISRQLLDLRLYHPRFIWVAIHAFSLWFWNAAVATAGLFAAASGDVPVALAMLSALILYQLAYMKLWWIIDLAANQALEKLQFPWRCVPSTDETLRRSNHTGNWLRDGMLVLFALLQTQWSYPMAMWQALRTRRVSWRGITYEINGPQAIQRKDYHPISNSKSQDSGAGPECP